MEARNKHVPETAPRDYGCTGIQSGFSVTFGHHLVSDVPPKASAFPECQRSIAWPCTRRTLAGCPLTDKIAAYI
jgi:hypothetical protein